MISVRELAKSFGQKTLWRNLTVDFDSGRLHALTGPSGSGKTTLLNCIGLLEEPDAGQILLDGEPLLGLRAGARQAYRKNRLGYLFQNYALVENATVLDNLRIALGPKRLNAQTRNSMAAALETVGLPGFEQRTVHELSGGEQQRVALARLIVKQADVILADEPTGALDDINSQMVLDSLRSLAAGGATVIIATHDRFVIDSCDSELNVSRWAPSAPDLVGATPRRMAVEH